MRPTQQARIRVTRRQQLILGVGLATGLLVVAFCIAVLPTLLRPARQVTVHVDGEVRLLTSTHAKTVGEMLAEAGIAVGALDRVSPAATSPLSQSVVISIVRVQTHAVTRILPLPYARVTVEDPLSTRHYRRVTQAGVAGSREVSETVTTENGVDVQRVQTGERILTEAVPERMTVGSRSDPALDAFYDSAIGYLGRGGVTRLTPSVVEQTVFELAHLRGDHYGSARVLTRNGRPWLVLQTFSRTSNDVALFVFWWTDELHAYGQVLSEGTYLLDARAQATEDAIELGLVLSAGQGSQASAPQYALYSLTTAPQASDTWSSLWSSQGLLTWHSGQGTVAFSGEGIARLSVLGVSSAPDDKESALVACVGCPRRRFESVWQREGNAYLPTTQGIVPSPFATLWAFADALHSGNTAAAQRVVSDTGVISAALKIGLGRPDLRWTTSGSESDASFDLRSKEISLRVSLAQRGVDWIVTAVGPVAAQGKVLYTGTRPIVRGLYVMDTAASNPSLALGEGERYVWSPDYAHLAYDWQGQVYVAEGDGSNARSLGPGLAPSWSADGAHLAFERPSAKGAVIMVYDLEGSGETVLIGGSHPAWAPGSGAASQRIVYSNSSRSGAIPAVYLIDLAAGTSLLLASDGSEPLWSPDGAAVAFLTSRGEIAVVTLTPGSVATVGTGWGYTWSPDGQALAYVSAAPAGKAMVWKRLSGESKPLLERGDVEAIAWSPSGSEIVVSVAGSGGLWRADSDGANLRKLGDGRDPVWAWPARAGR